MAQLTPDQIDHFIDAWYEQLAAMQVVTQPVALSGKLKHAVRRPDLWRLAPNPLLLTVMAIVHSNKGELPDARALLYEDVVDLLLWRWEAVKLENPDGSETTWRRQLQAAGLGDIDLKAALWELAFNVHGQVRTAGSSEGEDAAEATADIPESELLGTLRTLHPDRSLDWSEQLAHIMKLRAGLLVEARPGVYAFPHRTFQEYLAGCHLSIQSDFTDQAKALALQGVFWWEVILLAVGRLVHSGTIDPPLVLVDELCPEEPPPGDDEAAWRNVWLAGRVLLEIGLVRAGRRNLGKTVTPRVRRQLTHLITHDCLDPRERAEAASTLSAIGDPRNFDAMVTVPAGPFLLGSSAADSDARDSERPQQQIDVGKFSIAAYPVTNAQYARFVEATGHEAPSHWQGPTPPAELRTHPVVTVSWRDALAYCAWLSRERGETVRLPTEAEWEKAARGTGGRIYPWGNDFDADRCNASETGIGITSVVGIFAHGASPCGCLDMSGNVREWCSTQWQINYEDYAARAGDDLAGSASRVVRGGSFGNSRRGVRCAYRNHSDPNFRSGSFGFRVCWSPGP